MRVTHALCMDLARSGCKPIVGAVQGEGNTRALEIYLFNKGVAWELPDGATAAVAFQKPDGTAGLYDKLPNGNAATTISGNTVTAVLAPQVLTCAGMVLASIVFYDAELDTLATFPFKIMVEKNPAAGEQLSNDYYALRNLDRVNAAYNNLLARIQKLEAGSEEFDWFGCVLSVNGKNPDANGDVKISELTEEAKEEIVATVIARLPIYDGEVVEE